MELDLIRFRDKVMVRLDFLAPPIRSREGELDAIQARTATAPPIGCVVSSLSVHVQNMIFIMYLSFDLTNFKGLWKNNVN